MAKRGEFEMWAGASTASRRVGAPKRAPSVVWIGVKPGLGLFLFSAIVLPVLGLFGIGLLPVSGGG